MKQIRAAIYLLFELDMDDTDLVMELSGATQRQIDDILNGRYNHIVHTGGLERFERTSLPRPIRCKCGVRIRLIPCQYCRCGGMLDELLGQFREEYPYDSGSVRT